MTSNTDGAVFMAFVLILGLMHAAISRLMADFYKNKPVVKQNLIDLIHIDTLNLMSLSMLNFIIIETVGILLSAESINMDIFLVLCWIHAFVNNLFIVYLCLGVIVRYIFVYTGSFSLFEDLTDDDARMGLRIIGAGCCIILCLSVHLVGARPNRFLRVFGTDDYDLQFTGAITYYITSGLATVINIILRLALIKAERTVDLPDNSNNVQNIEEEDQRRMAMRGMVFLFVGIIFTVTLGFTVIKLGGGIWIFYSIVFILIPSVILATDKAMRNHSVKVILEFGKSIREKIKRFTTRNTVAPAPDVA